MAQLLAKIKACRKCIDDPVGIPLGHQPRPVLQFSPTAEIGVFGQAPGTRVHTIGKPFADPSGDRLRSWMGVDEDEFYDVKRIAIVPMGFCFPGLDAKGADLPPRRECAPQWRQQVLDELPNLKIALLIGAYAQKWHLKERTSKTLTETVQNWRSHWRASGRRDNQVRLMPLPHPSWRNNAWLKRHPWFETELLPVLRRAIRKNLKKGR